MTRRAKGKGYIKKQGKEGFYFGFLRIGKKVHRIKLSTNEREARKLWDAWLAENAADDSFSTDCPLDSVWAKTKEELEARRTSEVGIARTRKAWDLLRAVLEERGVKDLSELTAEDVSNYVRRVKGGDETKNKAVVHLRKIVSACLPDIPPAKNPLRGFKTVHGETAHRQPLTNEEIAAIRKAAQDSGKNDIDAIVVLSLLTGLRAKDCAFIKVSQYRDGALWVTPFKTRHSVGTEVAIPVAPMLAEVLSRAKPKDGYFFPRLVAKYRTSQASFASEIRKVWEKAAKTCPELLATEKGAGGRRVSVKGFHALRATFASRGAESNVEMGLMQGMMGHIGPSQTQAYMHPGLSAKAKAVAAIQDSYSSADFDSGDARFAQIAQAFDAMKRKALEDLRAKIEAEKASADAPKADVAQIVKDALPPPGALADFFDWSNLPPPPPPAN